jgi:chromosome partitioning protein
MLSEMQVQVNAMRIISIANQKGGCGKTTTAVNVAAALALSGHRTLMVDFDPQGHGTLGLGRDPGLLDRTMHDVMIDETVSVAEVVLNTRIDRLSLAPSNMLLGAVELELSQRARREMLLAQKLREVADGYEYAVIDCPPQLGLLMINALVASQHVVITMQMQYYALQSLKRLLETLQMMRQRLSHCHARTLGLLATLVEDDVPLSRLVQRQLRDYFGPLVFDNVIHQNTRLAEAPNAGEPVLTYAPRSRATFEYKRFTHEMVSRIENCGGIL